MLLAARSPLSTVPEGSPTWWYYRWSRCGTIVATLVFLAATHYPKLVIGEPGDGPDKLLHLSAFMVLTTLYRISGIASSIPRAIGLMLVLAILDEITQELPGLNRSFDPVDLVADLAGILLASAWLAAMGPPAPQNHVAVARYERRLAGVRLLLSRTLNWFHLLTAGTFGALVGGTVLAVLGRNPVVGPVTMLVVGAMVGATAALVAAIEAGRRQMDGRLLRDRRCLRCLEPLAPEARRCPCGGASTDEAAEAIGHDAGANADGGTPIPSAARSSRRRYSVVLPTVLVVVVVSVIGVSLDLLHVFTSFRIGGPARGLVKWFGDLPVPDAMAFDAAFLGAIAAGSVAVLRRRSDRRALADRWMCGICGYDLRHLASRTERPICPECGGPATAAIAEEGRSGDHGDPC